MALVLAWEGQRSLRKKQFDHTCLILAVAGEAKSRPQLFVFPEHLPDVVAFLKFSLLLVSPWPLKAGRLIGNKPVLRLPKEVGRTNPHTTLASACNCCAVTRGFLLGHRDTVNHG